jgi:hypothetical protein
MTLSKFYFIIATIAFILIAAVVSYATYNNPVVLLPPASVIPTETPSPTPTVAVIKKPLPSPKASVDSPVPTQKPQAAPTPDIRCIIVVDGQKYDVTGYKSQHSGGNIFSCGTDMSSIFHQQHNQRYLQMMAPYKI